MRNTQKIWSKTIGSAEDFDVQLKKPDADVNVGQLSQAEIEVLQQIFAQYGHWNRWKLIDQVMHKLPEWHNPDGSMIPIEIRDILTTSQLPLSEQIAIEEELENVALAQNYLAAS
jgi:hypothetical protein